MIKIDFENTDKATGLTLKDAILLTDEEAAALGDGGIEAMKATRLANYVAYITAPPAPEEETPPPDTEG
jgi:hypothetical protein